jgi:phage shock protein A
LNKLPQTYRSRPTAQLAQQSINRMSGLARRPSVVQQQKTTLAQMAEQIEASRQRLEEIRAALSEIDQRFTQASAQFHCCQETAAVVNEQARLQIVRYERTK